MVSDYRRSSPRGATPTARLPASRPRSEPCRAGYLAAVHLDGDPVGIDLGAADQRILYLPLHSVGVTFVFTTIMLVTPLTPVIERTARSAHSSGSSIRLRPRVSASRSSPRP